MTYIDKEMKANRQLLDDILHLMSMSEDTYYWLRVDGGTAYLREVLLLDQWSVDQLRGYAGFWAWWNQQWINRDREFLNEFDHAMTAGKSETNQIREFYINEYNTMDAMRERPYQAALNDSYDHMIRQLIKGSQREKLNEYVKR